MKTTKRTVIEMLERKVRTGGQNIGTNVGMTMEFWMDMNADADDIDEQQDISDIIVELMGALDDWHENIKDEE